MKHQKQISDFRDYFDREIERIKATVIPRMYKKMLYTSIIDALGQARYPKGRTHDRIVTFVYQYSDWTHRDQVSLVQLSHNLEFVIKEEEEKRNSKLFEYVRIEVSSFTEGRVYRPDNDPLFKDIMRMVTTKEEGVSVKCARYVELFYTYRNTMIHEYREPGYGIEMSNDESSPYYHSYLNGPWATVFPLDVFRTVCKGCLNGLVEYLSERDIDPFEQYEFGFRWTQERRFGKFQAKGSLG